MNNININQLLNQYVADTAVFVIKLHNIHWNVVGEQFIKIHDYTERLYDHFFKTYDNFAEVLKIKGQSVYGSMKEYLKITTIQELESKDFRIKEALVIIKEDLEMLNRTTKVLRDLAHTDGDITCTLLAEEEIQFIDKELWFIRSMLQ
jgi:starvation-inducible DNA-binding protein